MQEESLLKYNPNLSASALLASLHDIFVHNAETSVGIDNVSTLLVGKRIPESMLESIWQHSFKQSEDELLLLYPAHEAAHSLLLEALSNFPGVDTRMLTAWTVLQPFLTAMSPQNLNQRYHNGISASLSLNAQGEIVSVRLRLAAQPLLNLDPLLDLPSEPNWRSFDVFYHMLYSQQEDTSKAEMLGLKSDPSEYAILRNSETYKLPNWVTFADDYALAKDWADAVDEVFPKSFQRALMMTLSGILLLGNGNENREDLAEGAALIGLDSSKASKYSVRELLSASYTSLLISVEAMVNKYLATLDLRAQGNDSSTIFSVVTLAELSSTAIHRYNVLRAHFDNGYAMNSEMAQDGLELPKPPSNVNKALLQLSKEPSPPALTELRNFGELLDTSVRWYNDEHATECFQLDSLVLSNRVWTVLSIAPSDIAEAVAIKESWTSHVVSAQIRNLFITEWATRSSHFDYTADYDSTDFVNWFQGILPEGITRYELANWAETRFPPSGFFQGHQRVYLSEETWLELEAERDAFYNGGLAPQYGNRLYEPSTHSQLTVPAKATMVPDQVQGALEEFQPGYEDESILSDEEGEPFDDSPEGQDLLKDIKGRSLEDGQHIEVHKQSRSRKAWVAFVWAVTFWAPSLLLQWIGRMKRRDVRLAWREKITIFFLIILLNGGIIFYMIVLGKLICPEYDKVWNHKQLGTHQGTSDFYVGIHGNVYDITKFYKLQHSDNGIKTSSATMMPFAGQDLSDYFPPPLSVACPSLVSSDDFTLVYNTTRSPYTEAMHKSGPELVPQNTTALHKLSWYSKVFEPKIKNYYKGRIVETKEDIQKATSQDSNRYFVILNQTIYDMSNYIETINQYPSDESEFYKKYNFFPSSVTNLFQNYQGEDITDKWNSLDEKTRANSLECMNNAFVYGHLDFRHTAKCQAANVILLVFAGLLTSITLIKFLASIRIGSKPMPTAQDKFVLCQVPIYTEGEDDMRLAIDSLTNLKYDNRRKLLLLICDGMITGAGNDRPTPEIALDLLGVDESRLDVQPKAYHAIAEGSRELNYAKVYSGLHENEGDMIPFICIVKVGAPGESKPGNRGKRDSQLIIMNFLNRVHYGSPMCPLDLEIFHHMNNVIGIEPERFDYLLSVDADTTVMPDALNRMVAACVNDNSISAVCGETGVENEQQSLSTMIQVYEYFISHHLTKAFESLFGTVTCLPGCFSLFRLRTTQRNKPLLMSSDVIREYSLRHVDTLHKKNLFSLGEDRYLTTLMSKHFSKMKMKFIADAKCLTQVPDDFSVLLSQRRRWINSTVHNLAELLYLPSMCGFCLFSMRGIVFADLVGTLMLPSVVVYLVYLIYVMASHTSPLPIISIVLIAAVYGMQALVFILHRRWQHIFWMIVYIAAYPVHSFILPVYSFWNMDNFGWGNTRVVVDESKGRKVVLQDENDVYDPHSVPFEPWSAYALRNGLPGRERPIVFDSRKGRVERDVFEDPELLEYQREQQFSNVNKSRKSFDTPMGYATNRPTSMYTLGDNGMIAGSARPASINGLSSSFDPGTAAQIRDTIQQVLNSTDLDTMTPRQLRAKVGDLLGTEFTGERAAAVDAMIDAELERMDEEDIDIEPIGYDESASILDSKSHL